MKTKNTFKIKVLIFIALLFFSTYSNAQNAEVLSNLTPQQKEMVEAQKKLLIKNREAFKATLSANQLEILKNTSLSKEDRMKALTESLSDSQKKLLAKNRSEAISGKENFKATITEEQRQKLQLQIGLMKGSQEKKELREGVIENRKNRKNGTN